MARGRMRLCAAIVMLAALGEVHAQQVFGDSFEESCAVDSDGDRLSNCQEVARLTDYNDADTDNDGLSDGDEVLGTLGGLDLPAFGVNPRRKDILVEHDWQEENVEPERCSFHTHKPGANTIEELRIAFAAMPVPNPDGSTGINLIQDVGQGGVLVGGEFIDVANGTIVGTTGSDFQSYKAQHFNPNRYGFFHYVINTHRYTGNALSSGVAEVVGDDFLVTLGCQWNQAYIRNTIMHELGHNLGLKHGGGEWCNLKPNYNSVMNYRYQFNGIDTDCTINHAGGGDGVMNYSIGARAPLDENHLNENLGVCGGVPFNWDTSNGLLSDISKDINTYNYGQDPTAAQIAECGGLVTTLTDFDDFAGLDLKGIPFAPEGGAPIPAQEAICGPRPEQ